MASRANGATRDASQEPATPSHLQFPSRLSRAGTSLHRTRRPSESEDDDPTLRAPSRAMTDFRDVRNAENAKRFSREYTSKEPMPELQPSPSLNYTTSLRRPTVSGHENNLLFRDGPRRYNLDRQSSPALEKQASAGYSSRMAQPSALYNPNRASTGTVGVSRSISLGKRLRGASIGE